MRESFVVSKSYIPGKGFVSAAQAGKETLRGATKTRGGGDVGAIAARTGAGQKPVPSNRYKDTKGMLGWHKSFKDSLKKPS